MTRRSNQESGLVAAAVLTRLGFTRVSMGPAMSVMLGGLCGVVRGGEQRDRGQHGHGGLADGDDVGVRTEVPERLHDVLDVLVQPERPVLDRDVAGVVPVDDVHVVVGEQRADRRAGSAW